MRGHRRGGETFRCDGTGGVAEFFFISSSRRHTRSKRDWSSDVCSSDLLYADDYAGQNGFDHPLPDDPLPDFRSRNRSVMKPYGVWVVIAPYNFPFALAGGPVAARSEARRVGKECRRWGASASSTEMWRC